MKFNLNYIIRDIAGETLLVRQGREGMDMTRVVAMNESGAFLCNKLYNLDFTPSIAALALAEEYGIGMDIAERDAADWIKTLREYDAISD